VSGNGNSLGKQFMPFLMQM